MKSPWPVCSCCLHYAFPVLSMILRLPQAIPKLKVMEASWVMLTLKSVHVPSYTVLYCHEVTCQVLACWPMCRCLCLCFLLTALILWLKRILACALCFWSSYWVCSDSCTQQLWSSGSQIQERCFIFPKPATFHEKVKEKRELDEEVKTGWVFTARQWKVLFSEPFITWVKHWQIFWEEPAPVMREHGEISLRLLGASGLLYSLFRWS